MGLPDRMREYREQLDGQDFVAAVEAQQFVDMMRKEHPAELAEWMETNAVQFVTAALARAECAGRRKAIRSVLDRAFVDAEPEALSLFRQSFVVDDENMRRPLGAMTSSDLLYVAWGYETDAEHSMGMAAFMRALAQRVGNRPVAEVIDEGYCAELLRSFVGDSTLAAVA